MAISTKPTGQALQLTGVHVRPILPDEEEQWNALMEDAHPLGNASFPGRRIKYVAEHGGRAVALLCVSGCAYHLADRDRWIGWSEEQMARRRAFVVQNSRFLILGKKKRSNLASKVLSKFVNRVPGDWLARFGFEPMLMETFVDPVHFRGTCYNAAGWTQAGTTRGFRRDGREFYSKDSHTKQIWLKPLRRDAAELLRSEQLAAELRAFEAPLPPKAVTKRLGTERMHSLFEALRGIDDPRREQGRRYSMACCLSIVVCGVLGGCQGMRECAEFGASLTQKQLKALRAWSNRRTRRRTAPSRDTLWRVTALADAAQVERVVSQWFREEGLLPEAIALDGKTLRGTLLNADGGLHAVSAVSHRDTSPFLSRNAPARKARS